MTPTSVGRASSVTARPHNSKPNQSFVGSADILSQQSVQVPAYLEAALESQHAQEHGRTAALQGKSHLHRAADHVGGGVARRRKLISDSDAALLEKVYEAQRKSTARPLTRVGLEQVLHEYMVHWLLGDDAESIQIFLEVTRPCGGRVFWSPGLQRQAEAWVGARRLVICARLVCALLPPVYFLCEDKIMALPSEAPMAKWVDRALQIQRRGLGQGYACLLRQEVGRIPLRMQGKIDDHDLGIQELETDVKRLRETLTEGCEINVGPDKHQLMV
ncbi:unnamed protein product [Prorocentrum cordatum]|uniref:Uncharacterized protein n=1 Tax=Prorocentrum cordatum TaxID=2364126 RepID=A0ABN9SF63_9DINO|nr:unnamed protein product [Polarella glacialis]